MSYKNVKLRTLAHLLEQKQQVICLHHDGCSVMRIVALTGLSYPTVRKTIDLYLSAGMEAITPKPRGRHVGDGRRLTLEQEQRICQLVHEQRPEALGLGAGLWNRDVLSQWILNEFSVCLSTRGLDNYLARWGFAVPRPSRRICGRCPAGVKNWLADEYPLLVKQAKLENAEIYWGSEQRLPPPNNLRSRSLAGQGATRLLSMAAVSNRGLVRWMVADQTWDSLRSIEFMSALIKDVGRKVFLILEAPHFRQTALVSAWVEAQAAEIELFQQPGCRMRPPDCSLKYSETLFAASPEMAV